MVRLPLSLYDDNVIGEVSPCRQGGPMGEKTKRCMVCAKEKAFEGSICEECKAMIRGEASEKGKKIRKEAEKEIRREGIPPKK
jgi:predicted amidophosphoribosyltransferase